MNYEINDYLNKIQEQIDHLSHQQKTLFAVCCSETNFPLVEVFGEKVTVKFYRNTIDKIWEIDSSSFSNFTNEADKLLKELNLLPEAEEDDSTSKAFKVMSAIGVLYHTLIVAKNNSLKDASFVSKISNKNKKGVEFFLLYDEKYTRTIKSTEPPAPMTVWDKKELNFQREIIDLIENEKTLNRKLIEILREKSKNYANEFLVEVKKYSEKLDSIKK